MSTTDHGNRLFADETLLAAPESLHVERDQYHASPGSRFRVDRNESIRFNNQIVDLEALGAKLGELKRTNPDVAVVIRPDRDLPVQKLISLMDALQRAQIMKVGIATRTEQK